jgi:glycosyltransferase involved in cell wall biosynthesis
MKPQTSPLVSIIMPVYNGEKHLKDAIASILSQSYTNLEFIIIDDASSDASSKIIQAMKDRRIRSVRNRKNLGVARSLNRGLELAKGKYIARMDADDLSFPTRIEKQVQFLESNTDHGMVGTQYVNMDQNRNIYEIGAQLQSFQEIMYAIQSMNVFCHGSVMFRQAFIKQNNIRYSHCKFEDYELWTRLIKLTKMANIPDVSYAYMNNPLGVFVKNQQEMEHGAKKLGNSLQKTMTLPKISTAYLRKLIIEAEKYQRKNIAIDGIKYPSNFMLAYQTFLYKLGFVFLNRNKVEGLLLILLSFYLNPMNWIHKIISRI